MARRWRPARRMASQLAGLHRLVRLQGRHSPASAPGDRRCLPLQPRRQRPQGERDRSPCRRHRLPPQNGRPRATTGSEAVKAVLRGIRRTIGSAKQGKAPATADLIGQMIALCPDNMIGRRDRGGPVSTLSVRRRMRASTCNVIVGSFSSVLVDNRYVSARSRRCGGPIPPRTARRPATVH